MELSIHGPVVVDKHLHIDGDSDLGFAAIAFAEDGAVDSGTVQMFFKNEAQIQAAISELQSLARQMGEARPKCPVLEFKP